MASIVDNPSKILPESLLNDLKRKQVITGGDKVSKKPRFDDNTDLPTNTNGNHAVNCEENAPIDLSKINTNMEVAAIDEDKIITPEDIRKLKELLRQEEAKLQLIKRIKASITLSEPANKPKVKNPVGKIVPNTTSTPSSNHQSVNGIHKSSTPSNSINHTQRIKTENGGVTANGGVSIRGTSGVPLKQPVIKSERPTSPTTGSTEKMITTSASFEKNRIKREQLKQQLNKTLNEITQTPPPPTPDVNFFPSATNNEFLVLLGLEMCVNRLKKEDNDDIDVKSHECVECKRDFSPAWKYDAEGRLLCNRCISAIDLRKLTENQKTKFSEFTQFWCDKEVELKEIETQLQKDEKELRQQRLDQEKERVRREQEARKRQEQARQKEKEQNAKKIANQWQTKLNQGLDKSTQEMLQRYMTQQKKNSNLSAFGKTTTSTANTLNALRGNTQMHSNIVRQLQQLANAGPTTNSSSGQMNSINSNHLASLHTQMIKQEMLQKLRQQEREDNARQQALEQLKREQQMQIRQQQMIRQIQQQQQQQQQQAQQQQQSAPPQQSSAQMLRSLTALQTLLGANPNGLGNQQQLQQLLQANPALNAQLNPLLQALASQASRAAGTGTRSPSADRQHYIDILSPPKAHSNKR